MDFDKFSCPEIGKRLREIRKKKGVRSANALADLMNGAYSTSSILRREEGKLKLDADYITNFSNALNLTTKERSLIYIDVWNRTTRTDDDVFRKNKELNSFVKNVTYIDAYLSEDRALELIDDDLLKFFMTQYVDENKAEELVRERRLFSENFFKNPKHVKRIVFNELALYSLQAPIEIFMKGLEFMRDNPQPYNNFFFRIIPKDHYVDAQRLHSFELYDYSLATSYSRIGSLNTTNTETIEKLKNDFNILWENGVEGSARDALIQQAIEYYRQLLAKQ